MKRLLIASLMLSGVALAEDYVIATKLDAGYVVPQATMPYSLWTNSILWLTAESPVLNAGTTNAEWICYAKNCAGNATQTTITDQPARVYTNGAFALSFDGTDDEIITTYYASTNTFYKCRFRALRTSPGATADGLFGSLDTVNGRRLYFGLNTNGNWMAGYGSAFFDTGIPANTNWHIVELREDYHLYFDDVSVLDFSTNLFSGVSIYPLKIGNMEGATPVFFFNALIDYFYMRNK